jgi:excisionase family DNA binding protein
MASTPRSPATQFAPGERFLTVGVVAEFFGVTEVTIKNWVDAGQLLAARTVGGHRRIAASSVVKLLEEQGRPVPAQLARRKPVIVVLDGDGAISKAVRKSLGARARIETASDPFAGLLLVARVRPDVAIVELGDGGRTLVAALRADPQTKPVEVIATGTPGDAKALAPLMPQGTPPRGGGSLTFVRKGDVAAVVDAVTVRVDRPPTLARARRR